MQSQPLISIVINNYNYGRFLRRAVDSALHQSHPRIEVVVVDDGSTDDSPEIIASYGDRCTAVFGENRGQGAAYNAGFRACHGDIILFLDSDDILYREAAATLARAWRPDTAKAQFPLDVIDACGRPLGHRMPNLPFADGAVLPLLLSYGYYPSPPGSGNAFSRRALERILPLDEETWRVGSDGIVIGLAPLYGEVVSIREPLGAYRHHDSNHSEASGTSLAKIRRDLANEINREQAIRAHAAALGRPIASQAMSLRIPGHCKGRLLSLRLDPAGHPFPADRAAVLALAGIVACWRFPHHTLAKRVAASFAFAVLPFLPRGWLQRNLEAMIVARRRGPVLRRLLPELLEPEPVLARVAKPAAGPPIRAGVRSRGSS
ncbi:MAG TPA: glycosyltransferase [Stellaceae bacterium]|nr:glycosyltransferase [Stellaceae bacterium]